MLLIGIVAIGSLGLFVVATDSINEVERAAEQERIEQSFVQLSQSISTSTLQTDVSHHTSIDAGEHGAIARHDAASYEIWSEDNDGNRIDLGDGTLGTIEYESDDGTRVAYEGGAVFRETGVEIRILSMPPVFYDRETSTFQFSAVSLDEGKTIDSGGIDIRRSNVYTGDLRYIQNDRLYVQIESEYCLGWEQALSTHAGSSVVEEPCYEGDNEDGTLKARLGYDEAENAFSSGLALPDSDNLRTSEGKGNSDSIEVDENEFPPLNHTIAAMAEDFKNKSEPQSAESHGEFFTEGMTGTYNFDLSDGDATVVVNGSVDTDKITVSNCSDGEHSLQIYAKGDFDLSDDVTSPEDCDISTIQLYGTDTSTVRFHDSSSEFRGLIYVASNKFDPDDGLPGGNHGCW